MAERRQKKIAKRKLQEKEEKKIKGKVDKIFQDFKLDKIYEVNQLPKIKLLLQKADCNGWDDYNYITAYIQKEDTNYNPDWGSDKIELAYFGASNENGILNYYPAIDKVYLGDDIVTPQNFKPTLLKYLQYLLNTWKIDFEKNDEDSGVNSDFIKYQEELFSEIKKQL